MSNRKLRGKSANRTLKKYSNTKVIFFSKNRREKKGLYFFMKMIGYFIRKIGLTSNRKLQKKSFLLDGIPCSETWVSPVSRILFFPIIYFSLLIFCGQRYGRWDAFLHHDLARTKLAWESKYWTRRKKN